MTSDMSRYYAFSFREVMKRWKDGNDGKPNASTFGGVTMS